MRKIITRVFTLLLLYSPLIHASFGPGFWARTSHCPPDWSIFHCKLDTAFFEFTLLLVTLLWVPGVLILWLFIFKQMLGLVSGFWKAIIVSSGLSLFIGFGELFLAVLMAQWLTDSWLYDFFLSLILYYSLVVISAFLIKFPNVLVPTESVRSKVTPFVVPMILLTLIYVGISTLIEHYNIKARNSEILRVKDEEDAEVLRIKSENDWRIWLNKSILQGNITAQELDQKLAENNLDPRNLSRIFETALDKCREDYLDVILKYPMKPSPMNYPKSDMRSRYIKIESACENFFHRMGWDEGCEVKFSGSACEAWRHHEDQYNETIRKWYTPAQLKCQKDDDCFISSGRRCGTFLQLSKLSLSVQNLEMEGSMRCRYDKLRYLCEKENPSFIKCDEPVVGLIAKCQNSLCTLIKQH